MAQNRTFRSGPVNFADTSLAHNLLNPPTGSGGAGVTATNQYMIVRHIRIVNRTASPANVSLFLGASAGTLAGTEVIVPPGFIIAAGSFFEWFGLMRLDAVDFLTGGNSVASALTFEFEGELGVAG